MWKNGVHKVRGGTFAHTYLDVDELESIFRELYDVTQKCYRCLGDHFMQ